jgi:hypothetical protein
LGKSIPKKLTKGETAYSPQFLTTNNPWDALVCR